MQASYNRKLKSGSGFDKYFPLPKNKYEQVQTSTNTATVFETVELIKQTVAETLSQTQNITPILEDKTSPKDSYIYVYRTCRSIWNFVYEHIQYTKDIDEAEQVREPARTWADRQVGVDCDCYSTFISSVLTNLGIDHTLRMSGYNHEAVQNFDKRNYGLAAESMLYGHIYVVVKHAQHPKGYITLDCVKERFDEEHQRGNIPIHRDYEIVASKMQQGLYGLYGRLGCACQDTHSKTSATSGLYSGLYGNGLYGGYVYPSEVAIPIYTDAITFDEFIDKGYQALAHILDNSDRYGSHNVCGMLSITVEDLKWALAARSNFRRKSAATLLQAKTITEYEKYAIETKNIDKVYVYDKNKLKNGCRETLPEAQKIDTAKLASLKEEAKKILANKPNTKTKNSTANTADSESWYKKTPVIVAGAIGATAAVGLIIYLIAK